MGNVGLMGEGLKIGVGPGVGGEATTEPIWNLARFPGYDWRRSPSSVFMLEAEALRGLRERAWYFGPENPSQKLKEKSMFLSLKKRKYDRS